MKPFPPLIRKEDFIRRQQESRNDHADLFKWLATNELDLRTHREGDDATWFIWWTVVNPRSKKALGHPYGSPEEAIRRAMQAGREDVR